jgi:hypothetical protein
MRVEWVDYWAVCRRGRFWRVESNRAVMMGVDGYFLAMDFAAGVVLVSRIRCSSPRSSNSH